MRLTRITQFHVAYRCMRTRNPLIKDDSPMRHVPWAAFLLNQHSWINRFCSSSAFFSTVKIEIRNITRVPFSLPSWGHHQPGSHNPFSLWEAPLKMGFWSPLTHTLRWKMGVWNTEAFVCGVVLLPSGSWQGAAVQGRDMAISPKCRERMIGFWWTWYHRTLERVESELHYGFSVLD